MKKITLSLLVATSILSAASFFNLEDNPLDTSVKSVDFGGPLTAKEAYEDGVGIKILSNGNEKLDNKYTNLVEKYGEESTTLNINLLDYVINSGKATDEEIKIAEDLKNISTPPAPTVTTCLNGTIGDVTANGKLIVDKPLLQSVIAGNVPGYDTTTVCTSNVTDMSMLFYNNTTFNSPLTDWDTSNVTNMSNMFYNAITFNQPVNFDTSNVTNVFRMFAGARAFNQPINFDTSKATNMYYMFYDTQAFNQPLTLNTSNVTNMEGMFYRSAYNNPVNFNTSKVTNMRAMFKEARFFNQPVNFDTSNVTDMQEMFLADYAFNQPINFNIQNVTTLAQMFNFATSFNSPINLANSNANGTLYNTASMFYGASVFNQPVNINTLNVKYYGRMFKEATAFNQPLNFKTNQALNMDEMFMSASSFNQDITKWCVVQFNNSNLPVNFATGSGLQSVNYPVWGTCPIP